MYIPNTSSPLAATPVLQVLYITPGIPLKHKQDKYKIIELTLLNLLFFLLLMYNLLTLKRHNSLHSTMFRNLPSYYQLIKYELTAHLNISKSFSFTSAKITASVVSLVSGTIPEG